ncbi:S-adenosyl-l-methionine hydroxide adenosyltransferase family protein [Robiginitalea sp. SC105]|uniref:SAM hydrolase/SAM-dependent halogenase family protein n=1 Tax=Robiginitalea sp. SC105 TaxID=2762332 RepID=UPI00163B45B1|nr:SAM-dependent chlorinase/fluorinase [Robiginitalea sp. SC105]MBC2840360.1 SAM-dependent chlorinase/fluorinase [Robiginitalea sp. SC105]
MPIITLTTDFGLKDHFVGTIKGTIYKELREAVIVDISHQVNPFHIQECAYLLKNAYKAFPEGTIHIVGVDSERTPENTHLAVKVDGHYFITADNGVVSLIVEEVKPEKVVEISLPGSVQDAFPVLSVFVPAACHLARGGTLEVIGKPFARLRHYKEFAPRVANDGDTIIGSVIYLDNYGNVVTNIERGLFDAYRKGRKFTLEARNQKVSAIYDRYSGFINFDLERSQRRGPGDLVALFNSSGYLELAIYKSNLNTVGGAATLLGLDYRDTVLINFH